MTSYTHIRRDQLPAPAHARRDPLLLALAQTRQRRDKADRDMRVLLAFAREVTSPRPYRLVDLAEAAGMSKDGRHRRILPEWVDDYIRRRIEQSVA